MPIPEFLLEAKIEPIHSHLRKLLDIKNTTNIELEARVGRIVNCVTDRRIQYDTPHPIIFNRLPHELRFESGVEKAYFDQVKCRFDGHEKQHSTDIISISTDKIRKISKPGELSYQKKVVQRTFEIYLPESKYDIRVSVSVEESVDAEIASKSRFIVRRERIRESFQCNEYSFDFTQIRIKKEEEKKETGIEDPKREYSYEMEVEVKDFKYSVDEFISILLSYPLKK